MGIEIKKCLQSPLLCKNEPFKKLSKNLEKKNPSIYCTCSTTTGRSINNGASYDLVRLEIYNHNMISIRMHFTVMVGRYAVVCMISLCHPIPTYRTHLKDNININEWLKLNLNGILSKITGFFSLKSVRWFLCYWVCLLVITTDWACRVINLIIYWSINFLLD